jgi:hypothetical protein
MAGQPFPRGRLATLPLTLNWSKNIIALLVTLIAFDAIAQESPSPSPSPAESASPSRNIRISFVPPPLDGTISLGVYDAKGNLVRVLFREADINEFTIGNDALTTSWDGKNDSGENVPPGKYSAHGFVVGDLQIEGVGFFFNDWISSADAPRFSKIRSISLRDEKLLLAVDLVPPGTGHVLYDLSDKSINLKDTDPPEETKPGSSAPGRDGTRWVIEGAEVKQLSGGGESLRRLPVQPDEPQPKAIAASTTQDRIFLFEENDRGQRVRGLSLAATKSEKAEQAVSEWKVDFEKSIVVHNEFSVVDGKPVAKGGTSDLDRVKVKLLANPLLNDDRVTVEMRVGTDGDGSFLKAADGLPLCTISETQELRRALVNSRGSNVLDVFQDDGAVVEQFRISGIEQMMSFDCGGFELK